MEHPAPRMMRAPAKKRTRRAEGALYVVAAIRGGGRIERRMLAIVGVGEEEDADSSRAPFRFTRLGFASRLGTLTLRLGRVENHAKIMQKFGGTAEIQSVYSPRDCGS